MKKIGMYNWFVLSFWVLLGLMLPPQAKAQDYIATENDFDFMQNEKGNITITN